MTKHVSLVVVLISAVAACGRDAREPFEQGVPSGVERILPRDAIPAIFDPEFVSAEEANLPPDAEVIGVVIKGEARAYSINLLDGHEIVNDEIQGVKFAVTW